MEYEIGYLYQRGDDGRTWANGHGPIEDNLHIVAHGLTRSQALAAGKTLIGGPSAMGTIGDAYLVRVTTRHRQLMGEIRADGTLDRGFERPKQERVFVDD